MECTKCGGVMTSDYMLDLLDDSGVFGITPMRCLICGYRTDPVMHANRVRQRQEQQQEHPIAA